MATSRKLPDDGLTGIIRRMQQHLSVALPSTVAQDWRLAVVTGASLNQLRLSPLGGLATQLQQDAHRLGVSPLLEAVTEMQSSALPELARQLRANSTSELFQRARLNSISELARSLQQSQLVGHLKQIKTSSELAGLGPQSSPFAQFVANLATLAREDPESIDNLSLAIESAITEVHYEEIGNVESDVATAESHAGLLVPATSAGEEFRDWLRSFTEWVRDVANTHPYLVMLVFGVLGNYLHDGFQWMGLEFPVCSLQADEYRLQRKALANSPASPDLSDLRLVTKDQTRVWRTHKRKSGFATRLKRGQRDVPKEARPARSRWLWGPPARNVRGRLGTQQALAAH